MWGSPVPSALSWLWIRLGGSALCPVSTARMLGSLASWRGWPAGRGRWLCPSPPLLWGPIWSTASRPGAPSTGRMWSSCSGSRGGPLWSEGWNTSPMKKGWRNWDCLAWRKEGSRETSLWPSSTWRERINRRGNGCLWGWIVIGQGGMVLNWDRGGLG